MDFLLREKEEIWDEIIRENYMSTEEGALVAKGEIGLFISSSYHSLKGLHYF